MIAQAFNAIPGSLTSAPGNRMVDLRIADTQSRNTTVVIVLPTVPVEIWAQFLYVDTFHNPSSVF